MATRNPQRNQSTKAAKKVSTARADSERRTLSVEEAGRVLGISRQAAYTYANAGTIPVIRLGACWCPKPRLKSSWGDPLPPTSKTPPRKERRLAFQRERQVRGIRSNTPATPSARVPPHPPPRSTAGATTGAT